MPVLIGTMLFKTFIEIENFCWAPRFCVIGKPTIAANMLSIGT